MPLKYQFILYSFILNASIIGLSYWAFRNTIWVFILLEIVVLISIYYSFKLYKKLVKPINLVRAGAEALKEGDFTIKYVKTGSNDLDSLIDIYNLMIDTLREERSIAKEQNYFLEKLVEASPIGILILDYEEKITKINPSAVSILKLNPPYIGRDLSTNSSTLIQKIQQCPDNQSLVIQNDGINRYRCSKSHIIHFGFKRRFIMIEDLSSELLKNEKEAYGKVIRMMAHEVNNSMGAINSILQTILDYYFDDTSTDLRESLQIAIARNTNLSEFVKNFASILKVPDPILQDHNLNDIILSSIKIWEPLAQQENIRINFSPNEDYFIRADRVLMEQVIHNMLKNAIEATNKGQSINIITNSNSFTISNPGCLSKEVESKLFSPFFSTKPTGQGIGLMLIREILLKHQAIFSLHSANDWIHFSVQFKSKP